MTRAQLKAISVGIGRFRAHAEEPAGHAGGVNKGDALHTSMKSGKQHKRGIHGARRIRLQRRGLAVMD